MPRSQRIAEDQPAEPWTPPLPPAVQRQVDRANELVQNPEAVGGESSSGNPPADAAEGTAPGVIEDSSAQGEVQVPVQPPEPAPQPASPPDWEQRFNTLQGKYNSEVRDLQAELRVMRELQNYDRNRPVEQIPPPTTYQTYQPPPAEPIPPEDVESFGQDLITATQRWAAAQYQPVINQLEQRLRQVEQGNQNLNMLSVTERCERELDNILGSGWRQVNREPDFLGWLAQIDPFSNRTRQSMINEAYGAGDANRTAYFFQAYQREHTAVTPAPTGTLQARQGGSPPAASQPLLELVAPGRTQTAPLQAPGAPTKRMWTRDEIAAFYRSKQRGAFRGREAQADQLEADFISGNAEGRIRQ